MLKKIINEKTGWKSLTAERQRTLLEHWIPFLAEIQEIELVWLEGSLASSDRETPGSDIDINFAIADSSYEDLWEFNREKIFAPLGELFPIKTFSVVTEQGVLIEFSAYKTSEVIDKEVFEWEFLINRLLEGQPNFKSPPHWGPPQLKWPYDDQVTIDAFLDVATTELLRRLSIASTPFYYKEPHSAHCALEMLKTSLLHVLYYRNGIQPFVRASHLPRVLGPEALEDYRYVQFQEHEHAFGHSAIAKAMLRTFNMLIKNIKALHEKAGTEAPDRWIQILYQKAEAELGKFI